MPSQDGILGWAAPECTPFTSMLCRQAVGPPGAHWGDSPLPGRTVGPEWPDHHFLWQARNWDIYFKSSLGFSKSFKLENTFYNEKL